MIVRNEAHVIERCLESVKHTFTEIIIHDTGSTDDTKGIIKRWIDRNGKHGYVVGVEWRDFGYNRSEVLKACRSCADFTLMMDADESFLGEIGDLNPDIDTYQMTVELGDISFRRNFLFNNRHAWTYAGVVHEYPVCEVEDFKTGYIDSYCAHILSQHDGARSNDKEKYLKDAALLEAVPNKTPRDIFYLAQSYRDAGDTVKAQMNYAKRVDMGGWYQEVAYSYYMLGKILKLEPAYLKAYEADPRRAEPLLALGKLYMDQKLWHVAYLFLTKATLCNPNDDMLFREDDVYRWRADMEYAVCLHYVGEYYRAVDMNELLLEGTNIPPHVREQVQKNLQFAQDAMDKYGD